jgi:hypothetical protein
MNVKLIIKLVFAHHPSPNKMVTGFMIALFR